MDLGQKQQRDWTDHHIILNLIPNLYVGILREVLVVC